MKTRLRCNSSEERQRAYLQSSEPEKENKYLARQIDVNVLCGFYPGLSGVKKMWSMEKQVSPGETHKEGEKEK